MTKTPKLHLRLIWKLRNSFAPAAGLACRLPSGHAWRAYDDVLGQKVWFGAAYEEEEHKNLLELVKPGNHIVECGSHQGIYTVALASRTGEGGSVRAFEPSSRDRSRLVKNLRLNDISNVTVDRRALGSELATTDLYICSTETGCNSLRPPDVDESVSKETVEVWPLDKVVAEERLRVDLLKIDAEGAELPILEGAAETIRTQRPLIFCEVADIRTRPWGYPAVSILEYLSQANYEFVHAAGDDIDRAGALDNLNFNVIAFPR